MGLTDFHWSDYFVKYIFKYKTITDLGIQVKIFDIKLFLFIQQVFFWPDMTQASPKTCTRGIIVEKKNFSAFMYIWAKSVMSRDIHTLLQNQ